MRKGIHDKCEEQAVNELVGIENWKIGQAGKGGVDLVG